MAQQTLSEFPGLAPNLTGLDSKALLAENVDFSGKGLKPVKAPEFVASGHTGEFAYYRDGWVSGRENYIVTSLDTIDAYISKDGNTWRVKVGDVEEAELFVQPPKDVEVKSAMLPQPGVLEESVTSSTGAAIPAGRYEYFTRFREVDENGDTVRESQFSAPLEIGVGKLPLLTDDNGDPIAGEYDYENSTPGKVNIKRPDGKGQDFSILWVLYRRLKGETYVREVSAQRLDVPNYIDNLTTAELGRADRPEAPVNQVLSEIEYKYLAVWVRDIGGWITESTPSEIFTAKQEEEGVRISLNEEFPTLATGWRLYRLSIGNDPTTTFQLVADLDTETKTFLDTVDNVDAGRALASSYRSDNGSIVTAGIPDGAFTGMAGPFNGFYVGWIGADLYLSEPGNPSWWPGAYVVQANSDIVGVAEIGADLAVITDEGVQFSYGTTPDSFTLGQGVFGTGAPQRTAIDRNYYLGFDGIYQIGSGTVERITKEFTEHYFFPIHQAFKCYMVLENEQLIMSYGSEALRFDLRSNKWSSLNFNTPTSSVYRTGGEIYAIRENAVIKLFASESNASMKYENAGITFGQQDDKRVEALRFAGKGKLYVKTKDSLGTLLSEGEVNMDSDYRFDSYVYLPAWAEVEGLRMEITGTGEVRSIAVDVMAANMES